MWRKIDAPERPQSCSAQGASGSFIASLRSPYNFIYKRTSSPRIRTGTRRTYGQRAVPVRRARQGLAPSARRTRPTGQGQALPATASRHLSCATPRRRSRRCAASARTSSSAASARRSATASSALSATRGRCRSLPGLHRWRGQPREEALRQQAGAPRVTLALDRHTASNALSKIAIVKAVAGVQVPGTPFATPRRS